MSPLKRQEIRGNLVLTSARRTSTILYGLNDFWSKLVDLLLLFLSIKKTDQFIKRGVLLHLTSSIGINTKMSTHFDNYKKLCLGQKLKWWLAVIIIKTIHHHVTRYNVLEEWSKICSFTLYLSKAQKVFRLCSRLWYIL